ncbi:DUF6602 domain-containing protein [Herpetosiphon giganteus]|uniref:DUF6602 domain-containing protein n=1 Tax=Herpetosiphon giganteus TaxID=2029754 RepID=UPI00195834C3|nr:DUF6602 domain-containing protein [Herpetosiphon giganteus]MBM7842585.1 hypothetical protein [Herpetosiphon giganteus]
MPTQKSNQVSVQQSESSLLNYHKSIYLEFESTKDRIRSLLGHQKHWLSDGEHKEAILRKILRQHVPEIMRIGTGFVSFPNGNGSNQQDILITDIRKPTLFKDHDLTIVTPDAVRAIIEVKTSQNKAQLQNTLTKMADNIANIRASREHDTRCFAGLFIYEAPQIKLNIILEVLHKVVAGDYNRVIDFVAFGASTFIQFSYTQFRSAMMEANTWYRYEIENLAPAYFISHLAWHLTEQRSQMSRLAYFPLGESIRQNIKQHLLLS